MIWLIGEGNIRTDAIRYYEKHGEQWGKYNLDSKCSLSEVYDHIKMQYRPDTNCISLTRNPNVALTYHSNNKRYILVRVTPEELDAADKIFDAGEYFYREIDKRINVALQENNVSNDILNVLNNVERATEIDEVVSIVRKFDVSISTFSLAEKQYLSEEEQLKIAKLVAKIKILESKGIIGNLIKEGTNPQLIGTMGNAYSSSEFIHYGDIERDRIINCPIFVIEVLSLLVQAKEQGNNLEQIDRIINKLLENILNNSDIHNEKYLERLYTRISDPIITRSEYLFLKRDYSRKEKLREELKISDAYAMTNGKISYRDTNIQLTAIRILSEMIYKKRVLTKILKYMFPEEKLENLLDGTFCINPELIVRQNNRGKKISETVNFLITDYGYDLDNDVALELYKRLEDLSSDELFEIYDQGIKWPGIQDLLLVTREKEERISAFLRRPLAIKYTAEAIIEGYNWKGVRFLNDDEKDMLASRLLAGVTSKNELQEIYDALNRIIVGKKPFTQEEIFAIIINIVIDDGIGDISYKELIESKDKSEILLRNSDNLQTIILPIEIDLLMQRGKVIEKLKDELQDLGISRAFINGKRIRNLYMAKTMVEEYDFGRQLSQEEKRAIVFSLLNTSVLDNNKHFYLSTFLKNIQDLGFSEQEALGVIINLAVSGKRIVPELDNATYSDLLKSKYSCMALRPYTDKLKTSVTEITIENAKVKFDSQNQEIIQEYIDLGLSEFAETKHIQNLVYVKKIVEEYDFGRELTLEEEKSIKYCLLRNHKLDTVSGSLISNLCSELEAVGFNKKEIYGMILNLAIAGKLIDDIGYDFNVLISTRDFSKFKDLYKKRNEIDTKPGEIAIIKAGEQALTLEQINSLKEEIILWGVDPEFLNNIDSRNLFTASKIIENYDFGRELSDNEKRVLFYAILDNAHLREKKDSNYLLSSLCLNLKDAGFDENAVFGIILNASIYNLHIDIPEYSYLNLISNSYRAISLGKNKNLVKTKVTKFALQKAISDGLTEEEITTIRDELIRLGINEEFLKEKYPQNMYMAKYIVEHCNFGRKLQDEEKCAIIKKMLCGTSQNIGTNRFLSNFCLNLAENGFTENEIYKVIIKLAVHNKVLPERGYSYVALLSSANKVNEFTLQKDKIDFDITEETILKAQGKPIEVIKKALVQTKNKGYLDTLDSVRSELDIMSQKENQKFVIYIDKNGVEHSYSIYTVKILFGIDTDISADFMEKKGNDKIDLLELAEYYNETHPKTIIDIHRKLEIFEEIKTALYTIKNKNGEIVTVNFHGLYEIAQKRYSGIRKDSVYIYLRKIYEEGNQNTYEDILEEIGRRYENIKSRSYTYLYPNADGILVETTLNSIVADLRKKNPKIKMNFDAAKKYIEKAIENGAKPEEAVSKGLELYILEVRKVQKFLLKNPETGEFEEATASRIKAYWKSIGFEISKDETVLKFLKQAAELDGIKPEEIVDKALELAKDKIQKFDFVIDETGKIEKLTISAIAARVSKTGKSLKGPALKKAIAKLQKMYSNGEYTEAEIVQMAIEEACKVARKKYPIKSENGEVSELTVAEIAKIFNINRQQLAKAIKELETEFDIEKLSKEELINKAIAIVRSKSRKKVNDDNETR